jgi:hypothetical protein
MVVTGLWIAVTSLGLTALNAVRLPWFWQFAATMAFVGVTIAAWRRFSDGRRRAPGRAVALACLAGFGVMLVVWQITGVRGLTAAGVFSAVMFATFLAAAWWTGRAITDEFRSGQPGNSCGMPSHIPDEPLPVAQVNVGMTVVDAAGEEAGTVTAVQMPGTDVRPDVTAGIAERLMDTGYLRIDGTGLLSNDTYAAGDQITAITEGEPGTVSLRVGRDELYRVAV